MRNNRKNSDKVFAIVSISLLMFMMCSIGIRFLVMYFFPQDNLITDIVFFDNKEQSDTDDENTDDTDWAKLYPFENEKSENKEQHKTGENAIIKYAKKIKNALTYSDTKINKFFTKNLFGYSQLVYGSNIYKSLICWNFTPFAEYNNIVKTDDNYFYEQLQSRDVSESITSTIELSKYCNDKDVKFLYVQIPSKISKYDDLDISGVTDFSNQNADSFLSALNESGVNTLDLREEIHKEGLVHHDLFFETDHHWKGETGLWAAEKILTKMRDLDFDTNPDLLSPDNFEFDVYKDWFLGSQGKKATLARAKPDDFTLIYPKSKSMFHYAIPTLGIDETDELSVMYDMEKIEKRDYMHANPYGGYNHGDNALTEIENKLIDNDYNVLLVHDSFANCVIPFMALDIKNLHALDLRFFNGSLRSYIKENKPDIVIVAYPCNNLGIVDDFTHKGFMDFR